jgi:hypothetical protein
MGWEMGIEPPRKLEIKRLPDAGGTHRNALEHIGIIIGRELDVEQPGLFWSSSFDLREK